MGCSTLLQAQLVLWVGSQPHLKACYSGVIQGFCFAAWLRVQNPHIDSLGGLTGAEVGKAGLVVLSFPSLSPSSGPGEPLKILVPVIWDMGGIPVCDLGHVCKAACWGQRCVCTCVYSLSPCLCPQEPPQTHKFTHPHTFTQSKTHSHTPSHTPLHTIIHAVTHTLIH